jgi:glycosyl transferase family 2
VTAQAIYALLRTVRTPEMRLLVVDNASTDGSAELLTAFAEAGLCEVIANSEQRYHGPALTQAMDHLAATQRADRRLGPVWVLDSDCIVLRPDTLLAGVEMMMTTGAGMVGQWSVDRWHRPGELLGLHCLLLDPAQVWRDPVVAFDDDGSPSQRLQESARQAGITVAEVPFTRDGYVVHLGRTTLRALLRDDARSNRSFDWARTHAEPHFMEERRRPSDTPHSWQNSPTRSGSSRRTVSSRPVAVTELKRAGLESTVAVGSTLSSATCVHVIMV